MQILRSCIALGFVGLATSAAPAQILAGTGVLEWQARTDQGWVGGAVSSAAGPLDIRLVASWNVPAVGRTYMGYSAMDVVVANCGADDSVSNQVIPIGDSSFTAGVPMRFGDTIKIDHPDDLAAPGVGPRWVTITQSPFTSISLDNPVVIYQFTLTLDSTLGTRNISSIHRRLRTGWTDPMLRMFVGDIDSFTGDSYAPQTELRNLDITVPAPGTLWVSGCALVVCLRRRRTLGLT